MIWGGSAYNLTFRQRGGRGIKNICSISVWSTRKAALTRWLFHMIIPSPLQAKQDLAESISTVVLQERKKKDIV